MATDWGKFNWQDAFNLDDQLSSEERMVRDTAAAYAEEKLAPRVRDAFRNEHTDRDIFNEMGELGLLGSTIEGYGCSGVGYVSYGLIAPRSRTCGFRLPLDDERAIQFGDVSHLYLWHRRPARKIYS